MWTSQPYGGRIPISVIVWSFMMLAAYIARADIAPTQFVGYGISPVDAHGLRMISAKVDIKWGTPCELSGTFVIENQTSQSEEINLGFPLADYDYSSNAPKPKPLTFVFNDESVICNPSTHDKTADKPEGSIWYRCPHSFKPGHTTVKHAHIPSLTRQFQQSLVQPLSIPVEKAEPIALRAFQWVKSGIIRSGIAPDISSFGAGNNQQLPQCAPNMAYGKSSRNMTSPPIVTLKGVDLVLVFTIFGRLARQVVPLILVWPWIRQFSNDVAGPRCE